MEGIPPPSNLDNAGQVESMEPVTPRTLEKGGLDHDVIKSANPRASTNSPTVESDTEIDRIESPMLRKARERAERKAAMRAKRQARGGSASDDTAAVEQRQLQDGKSAADDKARRDIQKGAPARSSRTAAASAIMSAASLSMDTLLAMAESKLSETAKSTAEAATKVKRKYVSFRRSKYIASVYGIFAKSPSSYLPTPLVYSLHLCTSLYTALTHFT